MSSPVVTSPWLIVAGDFTPLGGMDRANYALARYLAAREAEVHIVAHRAWPDLASVPGVTLHRVWRPMNRHLLGKPLLARAGRRVWRTLGASGTRAVVNGGNCCVPAVNWVHYVHAAWRPQGLGAVPRLHAWWTHCRDRDAERAALREALVIIANSERTKCDLVERVAVDPARVHVIYYGSDPVRFGLVGKSERLTARDRIGLSGGRPLVGFVGALGDRRKGFDVLFAAWLELCRDARWDADLVVVGSGRELPAWRARAHAAGLGSRIHFLGFRDDVADVVAAFDALVHPARYEAYGLSVHEAVCRGVPALVSSDAGVAERYSPALGELLIVDPGNVGELRERLIGWRARLERYRDDVVALSQAFRSRSWDAMAADIVEQAARAA
jgi:glycosyltransferase involved in cell wall biosynthesis